MKKILSFLFVFALTASTLISQPQTPTNLTATVEQWRGIPYVYLTWEGDTNNHVKFFVYKKFKINNFESKFFKLPFHTRSTHYKDFIVARGYTYSYFVIAKNASGESDASDTVTIEIPAVIRNAVLAGTVTDENDGKPLKHAWVYAVSTKGALPNVAHTNKDGEFRLNLSAGEYLVKFYRYGYLPEFYDNARFASNAKKITLAENDSVWISAALTKFDSTQIAGLSGSVTDSAGNPVRAKLKAFSLSGRSFTRISRPAFTDSLGNYTLTVIKGDSVVVFMKPLNKKYFREFYDNKRDFREADKIFVEGDVTGINFVADEKPVYNNLVAGKVTDEDSNPLEAVVTLIKLKDNHRAPRFRRTTLSDSLGNYQFSNLQPGNYIALAIARGGYLPTFYRVDSEQTIRWRKADTIVVTENSQINGIDFIMHQRSDSGFGLIAGYVNDGSNNPLEGAMVYALDANNNVAAYSSTDANGHYVIEGLLPGDYSLLFEKVGFKESSASNIELDYSSNITATANASLNEDPVMAVEENENIVVKDYKLYQNYPNPFNPTTRIKFAIPKESFVTLNVYNVLGEKVRTLLSGQKKSGVYEVTFNAKNLGSGIYFYSLRAGNYNAVRKMILLK